MSSLLEFSYTTIHDKYCAGGRNLGSDITGAMKKCGRDRGCIGFYYRRGIETNFECRAPLRTYDDNQRGVKIFLKDGKQENNLIAFIEYCFFS